LYGQFDITVSEEPIKIQIPPPEPKGTILMSDWSWVMGEGHGSWVRVMGHWVGVMGHGVRFIGLDYRVGVMRKRSCDRGHSSSLIEENTKEDERIDELSDF
jgi:hypothetical protein